MNNLTDWMLLHPIAVHGTLGIACVGMLIKIFYDHYYNPNNRF